MGLLALPSQLKKWVGCKLFNYPPLSCFTLPACLLSSRDSAQQWAAFSFVGMGMGTHSVLADPLRQLLSCSDKKMSCENGMLSLAFSYPAMSALLLFVSGDRMWTVDSTCATARRGI